MEWTDDQYKECTAKIKALADIRPVSLFILLHIWSITETNVRLLRLLLMTLILLSGISTVMSRLLLL